MGLADWIKLDDDDGDSVVLYVNKVFGLSEQQITEIC